MSKNEEIKVQQEGGIVNLTDPAPVKDFIWVVPVQLPTVSKGGITMTTREQIINVGRIYLIGPQVSQYSVGQYVLWSSMAGEEVPLSVGKDVQGKDIYPVCIRQEDIQATLKVKK